MRLIALALAGLGFSLTGWAADTLNCPGQLNLNTADVAADSIPARFKAAPTGNLARLTGVSLYDGPPGDSAALVPDSHTETRNVRELKWRLNPAHPTWVSCDYALGLLRLNSPITGPVTTCTATVQKTGTTAEAAISVTCQD